MIALGLGCIWIILVSIVAMVPYPQHRPYALAMLILFPFLLAALWIQMGWIWALALFLGALSIYRYPAIFLAKWLKRRFRGNA